MPSRAQRVPTLFGNIPEFNLNSIPDLFLWLRSDQDVFRDSSNKVSLWKDQSPNGNDFSQSTASVAPFFNPVKSTMNYKPSVQFVNGSSYRMAAASFVNAATSHTFIFAIVCDSLTAVQDLMASETGPLVVAHVSVNTGQTGFYDGTWRQAGASTAVTTAQILCFTFTAGTGAVIYRNNTSIASTSYTSRSLSGRMGLGAAHDQSAQYLNGHICEVAYWPRVISTDERNAVHSYMGTRYGITVA